MPEAENPSYLFGSMHVRDQRAFQGMEKVHSCIEACEALALEIDLSQDHEWTDPALLQFPDGGSLRDHLRPHIFERLRKSILKAFQIDLNFFGPFIPLALVEIISERIMQSDHPTFLDAYLCDYATQLGKTTLGLETRDSQQALLLRIPMEAQLKMLLEIGRNPHHYRSLLNHMTQLYQKGDLRALHKVSRKSAGGLRKWMLFDRNRVMANRIYSFMQSQSLFCAVGAAHLWGGKGVLRLLKQQGVKVKAIPLV